MSISVAWSAAQSGLRASVLRSEAAASNVSGAGTDGYARRDAVIVGARTGAGVRVDGLARAADAAAAALARGAGAQTARAEARGAALADYLRVLGDPADAISPAARLGRLRTALDTLGAQPHDPGAQRAALDAAQDMAVSLRGAAGALGDARTRAEAQAAADVGHANTLLADIASLDARIAAAPPGTAATVGLADRRAERLDALSQIVDVVARDEGGRLRLHARGGAEILGPDGVHALAFDAASGTLRAGGVDITPGRAGVRGIEGGRLAGTLEALGADIPRAGAQLDALAANLAQAMADADASLPAGGAGLFTDAGAPVDPTATEGLAGRIAVNDAVRVEAGGMLWRMRDGMGAATEGPRGSSAQVSAWAGALDATRGIDPALGLGDARALLDMAADMVGDQQSMGVRARRDAEAAQVAQSAFVAARTAAEGVDLDAELQALVEIEQAYAANARVIQTLGQMTDVLLGMV